MSLDRGDLVDRRPEIELRVGNSDFDFGFPRLRFSFGGSKIVLPLFDEEDVTIGSLDTDNFLCVTLGGGTDETEDWVSISFSFLSESEEETCLLDFAKKSTSASEGLGSLMSGKLFSLSFKLGDFFFMESESTEEDSDFSSIGNVGRKDVLLTSEDVFLVFKDSSFCSLPSEVEETLSPKIFAVGIFGTVMFGTFSSPINPALFAEAEEFDESEREDLALFCSLVLELLPGLSVLVEEEYFLFLFREVLE